MKLSNRLGVSTLALAKGQWFDAAAVVDADFTNGRFRYNGSNFTTAAAFMAAIGGVLAATGQPGQYEIGPYVAPDAPELLPDGRFDVTGLGAWVGSAATIAVAGAELAYTANAANSPGARRPINALIAAATGRAYRAKGKVRRGTVASTSIGFGIGGAGTFNFSGSLNITADALTDAEVFCGGFDATNASIVLRTNVNPVTGTAYAAEISLKEALPFKGFKTGEVSGIIEATTPPATGTQRVVWQMDDAAQNGGGIIERNFIRLVWTAAGRLALVVSSGNTAVAVEQANLDLGAWPASTPFKVAFSAKANDFRAAIVGRPVVADTSGIFPGVCGMRFGKAREVANNLWTGGSIQRVRLYPYGMDANAFLKIAAGPEAIAAWGDSLTAGAGATGGSGGANTYPAVAAGLFDPDRLVSNQGSGGQTSTQIAARMGGWPIAVTVAGDTIPASGPVAIPAKNINILFNSGLYTGQQTGFIAGVKGVLTTDGDGNWTFTRSAAGSAVTVAAGVQFVPELAETLRQCTAWLWLGRNGAQGGYTVEGDIAAAVASLRHGRYFVMSPLVPTVAGDPTTLNARLAATYGRRFVNVLYELQLRNDGSANDLADVAAGIVPRSLRSDGVHLNDAGYAIVAQVMVDAYNAFGTWEIAAWGDSLTYGYTPFAVFDPPRAIANQAVGGQSSTDVAARQGGVPILVTVKGNAVPATAPTSPDPTYDWDFDGTLPAGLWTFGDGASFALDGNGALRVDLNTPGPYTLAGITIPVGALAAGDRMRVEFDLSEMSPGITNLLCATTNQGVWSPPGQDLAPHSAAGLYAVDFAVPGGAPPDDYSLVFIVDQPAAVTGFFKLRRVRYFKNFQGAAVTAISTKAMNNQGPTIAGKLRLAGELAGIAGFLDHDGNPLGFNAFQAFYRDASGGDTAVPAGSRFMPSLAEAYRLRTQWLWAGRNNYGSAATVKADIAAMVAYIGHERYLVGSILNSADEPFNSPSYNQIVALNEELADRYGQRFVNVRAALLAGGNGSAGDNADIAAGIVPRSLRTDAIHLNNAGNAIVGALFHDRTVALLI